MSFPFGDQNPVGGYKVGDRVGIIYSDHGQYIFDNPEGIVVEVEDEDRDLQWVTVQVEVEVSSDRLFRIEEAKV